MMSSSPAEADGGCSVFTVMAVLPATVHKEPDSECPPAGQRWRAGHAGSEGSGNVAGNPLQTD
jgi:hypothetical protein